MYENEAGGLPVWNHLHCVWWNSYLFIFIEKVILVMLFKFEKHCLSEKFLSFLLTDDSLSADTGVQFHSLRNRLASSLLGDRYRRLHDPNYCWNCSKVESERIQSRKTVRLMVVTGYIHLYSRVTHATISFSSMISGVVIDEFDHGYGSACHDCDHYVANALTTYNISCVILRYRWNEHEIHNRSV